MTARDPRPRLREVLAQPGYRRLWVARTISQWGDTFNFVALALLIYDLTRSGVGVSGVVVAEILPVLLLAPVAGPLGDRWPRVRVMTGSDLCRVGLALVLAVWHEAPVAVYAVAFAMSVGGVFFNPAASSVLPALVRENELVAANSGIWTAAVVSQIVLDRSQASWSSRPDTHRRSRSTPPLTRPAPSSCASYGFPTYCSPGAANDGGQMRVTEPWSWSDTASCVPSR